MQDIISDALDHHKLIKDCENTPPGHDFQNPKPTVLLGKDIIERTCSKCGLIKTFKPAPLVIKMGVRVEFRED